MTEKFAIPGVGGIITKTENNIEFLLLQERSKFGSEKEEGLIEIPAGKIREYENIFDCLRREILEETGYKVQKIFGEAESIIVKINGYEVLNYEPFNSSQNLSGEYPIMVQTFICQIIEDNEVHNESNESKNIRWATKDEIRELLSTKVKLYPMHINTLEKFCKI